MKNKKLDCPGKGISVAYIIRMLYRQGISKVLRQLSNVNLKKAFFSFEMLFKVISNFVVYDLFDTQVLCFLFWTISLLLRHNVATYLPLLGHTFFTCW